MNKEYYLILDTETANQTIQPLPYDIGYAICDRYGNIELTRSFVVREIFIDCKDLMESAYYGNKIPQYWLDLVKNKRKLRSLYNIRKQIKEDMLKYNVTKVGAYNAGFDLKALNNNIRYVTKSYIRWFFPYNTEWFCIWNMACNTILNRPSFYYYALQNDFVSDSGNIQTSAENAYRYIINNPEFVEQHTGLEDVLIEVAIFAYCLKQHKKYEKNINSNCWRQVQTGLENWLEKENTLNNYSDLVEIIQNNPKLKKLKKYIDK